VGTEIPDDAGVFRISEDIALIQTVDFFTPVVDDPYTFGQIAATNSLSDVYAMGGKPLTVLNIAGFPACSMDIAILGDILAGGADKIKEAGAVLVGGHTVDDKEPKYGLSVTGIVHPDKVVTNHGARPGDLLIMTKPLGLGVITTGIKGGVVNKEVADGAIIQMTTLNSKAAGAMVSIGVNACTDITGFGFLGHAFEMCTGSKVGMEIELPMIPVLPGARDLAEMGIIPAGAYANRDYLRQWVEFSGRVAEADQDLLFDPQTSGGLLIAVEQKKSEQLMAQLEAEGVPAALIGKVTESTPGKIIVKGR